MALLHCLALHLGCTAIVPSALVTNILDMHCFNMMQVKWKLLYFIKSASRNRHEKCVHIVINVIDCKNGLPSEYL